MYPQAIYSFQQAVEKATKAVGLLLGLVKPTSVDLKKVSHATILGILLRYPERVEKLRSQIITTSKSPGMKSAKEELKKLGLGRLLPATQEMLRKLPSKEVASRQVPLVTSLPSNLMWDVTLNLDPSNPRAAAIFKMLDDAEAQWKAIDDLKAGHEKLTPYLGEPNLIRYFLNVNGKAFPEIAPLAFVSMWHEKETRYPPIESKDYWNPQEYSPEKGLVRMLPRLSQHARRLCEGATAGAEAALHLGPS